MKSIRRLLLVLVGLSLLIADFAMAQSRRRRPVVANHPMRDADPNDYLDKIQLPPGFKISLYAENVLDARSMTLGSEGTLFVGTRRQRRSKTGKVYAIVDKNGDLKADEVITIAEGLNMSNGVAFRDGNLYVAEVNRIIRFDNIEKSLGKIPEPVVIRDTFPSDDWHGWKFIRFGPDGKLYVPVGAPCNSCEPNKEIYASITRMNPDGSNLEIFAKGVRNTVGFDWHPETKEMWFTDNGRDEWGDDKPPDELNHAAKAGLNFGFPYRFGKALVDTTFKTQLRAEDFQPAALELPPHEAALGVRFYTGEAFPREYHNQLFIAEHGSWNRSKPDGYRISNVRIDKNTPVNYEHFATGWYINDKYWGRPVDLEIMPDGSILVSDDFANCIYRISYEG